MKKEILSPLIKWIVVGFGAYFVLGVFAAVESRPTLTNVAGFMQKLIVSPEWREGGIKYIGINEERDGNLQVYTGYVQSQKIEIGGYFSEEIGINGGKNLRYGVNHNSNNRETVYIKYGASNPGFEWAGVNYGDDSRIEINLWKNVNFDNVLVIKDNKVGINNPNPKVALDINGVLKIGEGDVGNLYVDDDELVYLGGKPIVPFYCGNGYVDSNYIRPIGAPDNVDLEECDNWPTNGDGCSNQCQLEVPTSTTVTASPTYSNNWSLTTTIRASTNSRAKLTRINFWNWSASLDPPKRSSYTTSRTYSTSSDEQSRTITVYARNNLKEVRSDIGDNDSDRPTASATTTVRVCNPTACAANDYVDRSDWSDTTCRDYGTKHLHHCESWRCVEYDTQSVWRAQNEGVSCGGYCGWTTYYDKACDNAWNCIVVDTTTYDCPGCKDKVAYKCNCRTETYECNCRTETYDCDCDWVEHCSSDGYCDIYRVCKTCTERVCDTCNRRVCDTCYRCP